MPYSDPEKQRQWYRDRRSELRAIVNKAKSVPCTDCHIQYPAYVMQFDHLTDKSFTIGRVTAELKSVEALHREIAKCEIVCANCHAERTHARKVARNGA